MTVNNVLCANEPAVNYHLTPAPPRSAGYLCVFQLSVLVFSRWTPSHSRQHAGIRLVKRNAAFSS